MGVLIDDISIDGISIDRDHTNIHLRGPINRHANGLARLTHKLPCLIDYRSSTLRNRSALATTLTDDRAIAAAATTGDSVRPKTG
jgi:hypothetical protein